MRPDGPAMVALLLRRWLRGIAVLLLTAPALAAEAGAGNGTLWRVRNGAGTVYIAGSLHQLRTDRDALPPSYGQAYAASERLAMELDMDAIRPTDLAGELVARAIDPTGRSLRASLGEQRWRLLQPRLAGLGLPVETLDRFEPWAVALLLASTDFLRRGYSPASGVEGQLQARAAADHKPIDGLETPQAQFELLDGLPLRDQIGLLDLTLEELDRLGTLLDSLEQCLASGGSEAAQRPAAAGVPAASGSLRTPGGGAQCPLGAVDPELSAASRRHPGGGGAAAPARRAGCDHSAAESGNGAGTLHRWPLAVGGSLGPRPPGHGDGARYDGWVAGPREARRW